MPSRTPPLKLRFPLSAPLEAGKVGVLPAVLARPASRGEGGGVVDLLPNVKAVQTWTLAPVSRSGDASDQVETAADTRLLALEAMDGTTVFIRADALAERVAQVRPEALGADGVVDLALFRDRSATTRGEGGWLWRQVTELKIEPDDILTIAREKAEEWLGEKIGGKVEDWAVAGASWLGAKALMWAVESRLAAEPGLYRWPKGEALSAADRMDDDKLLALKDGGKPALVFIHGTGSHTLGSFGELPGSHAWAGLEQRFGEHIYGFEHRSFSESPIDNALQLLRALPNGARINLVTHSRGGLVGDLLCLDPRDTAGLQALIDQYRRNPREDEREAEGADPRLREWREAAAKNEQQTLRELVELLSKKKPVIERYVRVACPARGTALLSDNLDVFLSALLTLVRKFGAWSTGAVVGLVNPLAAEVARAAADRWLKCLARVVLEIAEKRLQPQTVPGIEAMLPEAPMGMFLGRAPCRVLEMAVVAGDIEGGGWIQRIGVAFTDWMLFDRLHNDLVVDTASMYAGVALAGKARAIFVQGSEVNHFRYFRDATAIEAQPLPEAMERWLVEDKIDGLREWQPLPEMVPAAAMPATRGEPPEKPPKNSRPVVVFLPGIMGSELDAGGDRVWLNFGRLIGGALRDIAMNSGKTVAPTKVVELAYGKLQTHLWQRHYVETHAYDWRQPIAELGTAFAAQLTNVLAAHPDQPIRIIAHSMGGLVVRAAFQDKGLRDGFFARARGNRLLMLGTPNHGSHLMVQTLLGLSDTIRMLARLDLKHDMPALLDIVSGFQGAIDLLPAPGFEDTGNYPGQRYYDPNEWTRLKEVNDDFWFGRNLGGVPSAKALDATKAFWASVKDVEWVRDHADRITYVYGKAEGTPCGLVEQKAPDGRTLGLWIAETPWGDGSVTWASGRLTTLPEDNCWLMDADHMGLISTPSYFGEIEALLEGRMPKLKRLPTTATRGKDGPGEAPVRTFRAGPPPAWPTEAEATARLLGGRLARPKPRRERPPLAVRVTAMDLRFVQVPVLCGHYRGDPIAAAEGVINRYVVDGALDQRHRLGLHTGEHGDATVVLMPRSKEERLRGTSRGAVVVGLGEMGKLSADGVAEAVRAGVLRYLLQASDLYGEERSDSSNEPLALDLASLLIGTNSASQLDVGESVRAVVRGVLRGNRDFALGARRRRVPGAYVARLELVEMYLDAAISAARAVGELPLTMDGDLDRLCAKIEPDGKLRQGDGWRHRLSLTPFADYWPRLAVTDADRDELQCDPACYLPRIRYPIPPEALGRLLELYGAVGNGGPLPPLVGFDTAPVIRYAERLRFAYLGEKARSEVVVQQRQPRLAEKLVDAALVGPASTVYVPGTGFGATLFQLLVPVEFKATARKVGNMILVVDETTANLPWEMLEAAGDPARADSGVEGEEGKPLVIRTRVVRQFLTPSFRREVIRTERLSACVISAPSTDGYHAQFGDPGWKPTIGVDLQPEPDRLPELGGAEREGEVIAGVLEAAGYTVAMSPPGAHAADVFARLMDQPCRVLVVDAHGIFGKQARDGSYRSGVVLSDGLVLSAAEISLMETVPDLVFLNCCHLAKSGVGSGGNRLAAGLARELVDMGVRCVVAAGWEVRDDAARTFAETFFHHMAERGARFGDAIFEARRRTYDKHMDCNTWGAYQAYGDPAFRLTTRPAEPDDSSTLAAPEELLDWLEQRRLDAAAGRGRKRDDFKTLKRRIEARMKGLSEDWTSRADVNGALGRLYAEYGPEGFELARAAYLYAIIEDSSKAPVSITVIEQLINLEAREGERLSALADELSRKAADRLSRSAVDRAAHLCAVVADQSAGHGRGNLERQSIFGSANKRLAAVELRAGKPWADAAGLLKTARDEYRRGEGDSTQPGWNPYACINRLQLDAILDGLTEGERTAARALAGRCQSAARARFGQSCDFFDAVMAADAEIARWLLDPAPAAGEAGEVAAALGKIYRDAVHELAATPRQFDSVATQLRLLSEFLKARAQGGDEQRTWVLREVADGLTGSEPPPDPGPDEAADAADTPPPELETAGTDKAKPPRGRREKGPI